MTAVATDQEAGERRIDVIVTHYRFKETNS